MLPRGSKDELTPLWPRSLFPLIRGPGCPAPRPFPCTACKEPAWRVGVRLRSCPPPLPPGSPPAPGALSVLYTLSSANKQRLRQPFPLQTPSGHDKGPARAELILVNPLPHLPPGACSAKGRGVECCSVPRAPQSILPCPALSCFASMAQSAEPQPQQPRVPKGFTYTGGLHP